MTDTNLQSNTKKYQGKEQKQCKNFAEGHNTYPNESEQTYKQLSATTSL